MLRVAVLIGCECLAGGRFAGGGLLLAEAEPDAGLLAELLDELCGLLEVGDPLADAALQRRGDVEHGGLAVEGLAQIEGTVLGLVVRGAAASGLAAAAGHYDEAAVEEAFGLREELVEFAAALAFLCRQGGWTDGLAGHGFGMAGGLIYENVSDDKIKATVV